MSKNYVFQTNLGYDAEHSRVENGNWHAIVIIISEWAARHKFTQATLSLPRTTTKHHPVAVLTSVCAGPAIIYSAVIFAGVTVDGRIWWVVGQSGWFVVKSRGYISGAGDNRKILGCLCDARGQVYDDGKDVIWISWMLLLLTKELIVTWSRVRVHIIYLINNISK